LRPEPLPPAAARTLYNVFDAWSEGLGAVSDAHPAGGTVPAGEGGPDFDPAPAVAGAAAAAGEREALVRELAALERDPRLRLWSLSGFSWLPRSERRAVLAAWSRSPWPWRRRAVARLERLVRGALQSRPGA